MRTRLVSPRSFLAGLSPAHFDVFRALMLRVEFLAGEALFSQGEPSLKTFFIDEGSVELLVELPGGGERSLAKRHEGEILGELALMSNEQRTATARALTTVRALAVDHTDFRAMLSYFHPASLAVLRRLLLLVSARIYDLTLGLLHESEPLTSLLTAPDEANREPGFDVRAFLPALPFFTRFSTADIDAFLQKSEARIRVVPRGVTLFESGAKPDAAWLVVRGAVELLLPSGAMMQRIGVFGPGALVGSQALLLGNTHLSSCRTRENAVLLSIPGTHFDSIIDGEERLSFKVMEALSYQLFERLGQITRMDLRLEVSKEGEAQAQRTTNGSEAFPPSSGTLGGRLVLLVDDSPMNRGVLRIHVEEMGHRVLEAENGKEALAMIERERPDAILLDVQMPIMDGYQTLQHLQQHPKHREIPVIMITAVDSLESAIRCLQMGAEDYLPRTFDEALLHARLNSCFERARFRG